MKIIKYFIFFVGLTLAVTTNLSAHPNGHGSGSKVLSKDKMSNFPGNTLTSMTIELKPGEVSSPHRHAGFLFVYVLEGEVLSQLGDGPVTLYKAGESWVETPQILHGVAESASKSKSAYILVVFVGPDDEPLTTRVE